MQLVKIIIIFILLLPQVALSNEVNDTISNETDTIEYVPLSKFTYSDTRRYILTGDLPQVETHIKPVPTVLFSAGLATAFVLQHQLQMKTIWKDHTSFKFKDDALEELWIDKCGHVYGAYLTSYVFREALVTSGFGWNAANNIGATLGTLYSTYVEVLDGYGEQWGFSPTDFAADIVGGLFFAAQNYFPSLQNITPKFLYLPSEWTGYTSRQPHDIFIDDYSSQFFFYSINIYNMLPDGWKKYFPDWLELSVGYTVRNMLDKNRITDDSILPDTESISLKDGYWGSPRLVIALDYNLVKLLPDGGNTWNWLKQTLNLFKLPSPAIEIGKVTRFYLLFPFKIL